MRGFVCHDHNLICRIVKELCAYAILRLKKQIL